MTTNNPPIAAWAPSTALHKLESRHNNAPCVLTDTPAEFNDVALVRLADYEALQAECEELKRALSESRANDLTAMGYLNQIRQLVGGDDFPDMVRRCETLHKAIRRLCNLYAVDDYYSGEQREEMQNRAVERAIAAAMEGDKP